jgi:formylglycine-generating enzyme required for sulfatase activity
VVGITWYEAMAYCSWLNERLSARITNAYQVRLPTEAEWEAAAAFDDNGTRWDYPWGAAVPSAELADFGRNWQEGPKPVGGRPRGAAGCGALDMVGTVWEVTSGSSAASPAHGHDALTNDHTIIWRGAAYWNNSSYVHCGACVSDYPGNGNVSDGFRIVVALRIAD